MLLCEFLPSILNGLLFLLPAGSPKDAEDQCLIFVSQLDNMYPYVHFGIFALILKIGDGEAHSNSIKNSLGTSFLNNSKKQNSLPSSGF